MKQSVLPTKNAHVANNATSDLRPVRIFVDATYTLCSGKSSGIERVVRSIIRESTQCKLGFSPQVVISHDGRFYPISDRQVAQLAKPARMQNNVRSKLPQVYEMLAKAVCKVVPLAQSAEMVITRSRASGSLQGSPHVV